MFPSSLIISPFRCILVPWVFRTFLSLSQCKKDVMPPNRHTFSCYIFVDITGYNHSVVSFFLISFSFLFFFFFAFFSFLLRCFPVMSDGATALLFSRLQFLFSSFSCAYNCLIMVWWLCHSLDLSPLLLALFHIYERFIVFRLFFSSLIVLLTQHLLHQTFQQPKVPAGPP